MCKRVFWPFLTLFPKCTGPIWAPLPSMPAGSMSKAAGKTTILYKLKLGEVVTTIPTIGFNVGRLRRKTCLREFCWTAGCGGCGNTTWRELKTLKTKQLMRIIYIYAEFEWTKFLGQLWSNQFCLETLDLKTPFEQSSSPCAWSWPPSYKLPSTNPVNLFSIRLTWLSRDIIVSNHLLRSRPSSSVAESFRYVAIEFDWAWDIPEPEKTIITISSENCNVWVGHPFRDKPRWTF